MIMAKYLALCVDARDAFVGFLTGSSKEDIRKKADDHGVRLWREPRKVSEDD